MTAIQGAQVNDFQVVVVGFGPTGVVATSLLGAEGLRTLAIDKQKDVYDKPRAIAIDHEILRIFDNLGVAERVLPYVAPFPASQHFGAQGQLIRRIDMVPEPYPLGYTPTMVFTQPPVEAALREHAASYPDVVVELGTELLRLEQDGSRVTLHLRNDSGEVRPVMAFRPLPLFWSAACQVTAHPPIDEAFRLIEGQRRQVNPIVKLRTAANIACSKSASSL